MSSFFTKVIADILNTTAPIQYPTDGIRTSAAKRPPFLMEYSEEEKKKMGIPAGAESSGGKWYVKDKYVGYVEDGEFIHADSTEDVGTIAKVDGKHFYKVPGKPDREVYVRGRYVYTKPGPGGPANRAYLLGTTSGGGLTLAPTPPLWPGEEPEEQDDSSPVEKFISIQSKKNSVLSPLFDALRADNPEQIQTAVTELMLYRDEDGVLVSNRQGVGHLYGKDEKGVQAAQQLEALLSQHDIKIPNKRQLETSSAKAESFKPQNIPEGVQRAKISVARDDSGETTSFTFDGQTYDVIHQSPELRTRLVEEYFPLYEIFLKRGMSPEEAEQEAERVGKSITAHNKKIKLIAHETSERKDAFLEVTDNTVLGKTLARLVIEAAGENFTEQQRKTLEDIFTTLANAETPEAFDEMWSDATTMRRVAGIQTNTRYLLPLLRGANLPESAFPSLCESIEVLRKSAGGARVLIPTRQTFELVDIVVLRDAISISPESLEDVDKLTDDIAQQLQLVNVQVELVGVKSGQKGVGRPSASYTRILLTEYDTPETGADLLELLGHRSHTDLWQCATKDEFDQYAAKQLAKIQEYIDDVVEYYRFQDAVAGKDDAEKMRIVFALLANGTLPAYDANGEFLRAGREASLFRAEGVTELNREQMRLYSFIGYAADAIYNRRAQLQGFTNTTFGGVRIKETDGIEQMARAVFQFNRSASAWKNPKTQKTVIRPSYSFTANLEYTGALDDMQQFTRRGAREEEPTNELLLEYTVAQKRKIGIPLDAIAKGGKWYIGDKLDGKVVGVGDAKNYVKASPEEIAADSGKPPKKRKPAGQQDSPPIPVQKPRKKRAGTAASTAEKARSKRRESVGSILSARSKHPTAKDEKGNPLEIRYIVDENGNAIDTGSEEGRKQALEVINKHLTSIQNKTIEACQTFKKQASKHWLGGVGEMYAYKELLQAGVEAYLLPDSNPESDIVIINRDGDEKDLKIVQISVKSSLGEDVGQMGANAREVILKMVEGKTSNFDQELGDVSAASTINAVYTVREMLGYAISLNAVFGTTGKRIMSLSDEQLARCTPEYQEKYRRDTQTGEDFLENFAEYERNRLITMEDLDACEALVMRNIEKTYKKLPQDASVDEHKRLAKYYLDKLRKEIAKNPNYTMEQTKKFMIEHMGIVADNTTPPSDVTVASDLIGLQFDADTGIPTVKLAKASDVKNCVDNKTKSADDGKRLKWSEQLDKYIDVKWRIQHRTPDGKDRGKLQFKMNWAPEKNCTKESWQSVKDYVR
jgi:hypothetical protein